MTNAPRKKGTSAETALVEWFHRMQQPQVERHSLHGNKDLGDLSGIPGLVLSVKFVGRGKPMDLSGWLHDLQDMRQNVYDRAPRRRPPAGLLVVRRVGYPDPGEWYAVQELADWWDLFKDSLT